MPQDRDADRARRNQEAMERLEREEQRSRVTGTQADAQRAADAARTRVARARPERDDPDRGSAFPGFTRESRDIVRTTPPPGVPAWDFMPPPSPYEVPPQPTPAPSPSERRAREQSDAYLRSYLSQPDETAPDTRGRADRVPDARSPAPGSSRSPRQ